MRMENENKKINRIGITNNCGFDYFVVELRIPNPIPIPGVKLGLANIITVYAVYHYRAKEVFLIVLVRMLLGAVFSGNMMALLYSFAGSLLCLTGMFLLCRRISSKYIWICSVFGAVLHNVGQIAVACLIAGWSLLVYFPFLLVSGCIAGAFAGICAQIIISRLNFPAVFESLETG